MRLDGADGDVEHPRDGRVIETGNRRVHQWQPILRRQLGERTPDQFAVLRLCQQRLGVRIAGDGAGFLLAYMLLGLQPVDGGTEARAWCLGLGPLALLFGIGNLIYHPFAPVAHEPGSKPEPGMQDDQRRGRPGLV